MLELIKKLIDNFGNKTFIDGIITATILILVLLSSSSFIGNELVFNWAHGTYQGDFDWQAYTNESNIVPNDLGIIKESNGKPETMYNVYIQDFDSACIYKLKITKHDGKEYSGTYCLKKDNFIDNLEKYSVQIKEINQGLDKPIKVRVYRKVIISWYWLLVISILLFIYLMIRLRNKQNKTKKITKEEKCKS